MPTDLALNASFYPEAHVRKAIELFAPDVSATLASHGDRLIVTFAAATPAMIGDFANTLLRLRKHA